MRNQTIAICVAGCLGLAGPAAAADLFNNLGDPILGYETTSNGGSGPAGYPAYLAEAFYTGPSAFQLSDVALKLVSGGGGDPATTVTISLVADMPNIPSPGDPSPDFPGSTIADLGTLADPAVAAVPTVYTLAANQILAPNSIYWIKLESNVPFTETFWAYATVGSQLYYDGLSTGYPINFASPFEMRVSGSVVPEPASWGLTILGLAGVGSALRGRKRTVSA